MILPNILQIFFNGIELSSFYALFAVGLALIFGVMKIINFAYGELYMLGAYSVFVVISAGGDALPTPLLFFIGLVGGMLVVGSLSLGIERFLFRPLRRSPFAGFMGSVGLLYILQVTVGEVFGFKAKITPIIFAGNFKIAGSYLSIQLIVTVVIVTSFLGLLWFFLQRTNIGRALRASAQDSEAAELQGVNFNRMTALIMGIGGALAASAGALIGTTFLITPYMGWFVLWKAFIVIIVGGMGSVGGAIVSSLIFGFLDSLITVFGEPQLVTMIDTVVMLIILAFRPQGLLGREK